MPFNHTETSRSLAISQRLALCNLQTTLWALNRLFKPFPAITTHRTTSTMNTPIAEQQSSQCRAEPDNKCPKYRIRKQSNPIWTILIKIIMQVPCGHIRWPDSKPTPSCWRVWGVVNSSMDRSKRNTCQDSSYGFGTIWEIFIPRPIFILLPPNPSSYTNGIRF